MAFCKCRKTTHKRPIIYKKAFNILTDTPFVCLFIIYSYRSRHIISHQRDYCLCVWLYERCKSSKLISPNPLCRRRRRSIRTPTPVSCFSVGGSLDVRGVLLSNSRSCAAPGREPTTVHHRLPRRRTQHTHTHVVLCASLVPGGSATAATAHHNHAIICSSTLPLLYAHYSRIFYERLFCPPPQHASHHPHNLWHFNPWLTMTQLACCWICIGFWSCVLLG